MDMKRTTLALTLVSLVAGTLVGCGAHNYNLECDAGDYVQHDTDCGYVDNNNQWQYFSWTKPNTTTHSPNGWEPPAGVAVEQDDDSHKKSKPKTKKTTKPATKATVKTSTAKPVIKVVTTRPPVKPLVKKTR
jgi:hypothetical protein